MARVSHLPPGLPMSIYKLCYAANTVHKHRSLAVLHHSSSLGCCWLWRLAARALCRQVLWAAALGPGRHSVRQEGRMTGLHQSH